jgi:hypothetical protein
MMMLAPTQTGRFAADVRSGVTTLGDSMSGGNWAGTGANSYDNAVDQVLSYKGWNYVVIKKLCELISASSPLVGRWDRAEVPTGRRMNQRAWSDWNAWYGRMYQTDASDVETLDSHPMIELFERVNPEDTWADLLFELNLYLELTGCAYLWVIPSALTLAGGMPQPLQIEIVPTHWCSERRSRDGVLLGWTIQVPNASAIPVAPNDIIPFRFKSPLGKNAWTSPSQAVDTWIDSSQAVSQSRLAVLGNQGNPSMILKPDKEEYGDLDEAEARKLQVKIANRARDIRRHGEPLVLPPGIDVERWSDSPQEMAHIESDDQLRDSLFASRGVSKFIVGLTDDMNRADVEAAMVHLCEFTLKPRLQFIAGRLTEKLAKRWEPNLLVWFSDPTPSSWERENAELLLDAQLAAITPDERRIERGRKPYGTVESQTGWIASSMVPLTMPQDETELVDDTEPDPSAEA